MRFHASRAHRLGSREVFGRHDRHTSSQQSVVRCSKLGRQIDSESSSVKLLSQDVAELTAHFYGKYSEPFPGWWPDLVTLGAFLMNYPKPGWRLAREFFENT